MPRTLTPRGVEALGDYGRHLIATLEGTPLACSSCASTPRPADVALTANGLAHMPRRGRWCGPVVAEAPQAPTSNGDTTTTRRRSRR